MSTNSVRTKVHELVRQIFQDQPLPRLDSDEYVRERVAEQRGSGNPPCRDSYPLEKVLDLHIAVLDQFGVPLNSQQWRSATNADQLADLIEADLTEMQLRLDQSLKVLAAAEEKGKDSREYALAAMDVARWHSVLLQNEQGLPYGTHALTILEGTDGPDGEWTIACLAVLSFIYDGLGQQDLYAAASERIRSHGVRTGRIGC